MSKLYWDQTSEKLYETGVEQVALYKQVSGAYPAGVAWNGVTALNISPSGAEPTPLYANDTKYLNLMSNEELGFTLEAYTYPEEWEECDGSAEAAEGVYLGQQPRVKFGLAAKTLVGNDTEGTTYGYKLHLFYGCLASPAEESHATVNDSPEAVTFSWTVSTEPVSVEGYKPTSYICIDSTKADPDKLATLEAMIYGSDSEEAKLPMPSEVISTMTAAG